ncbi:MAG: hypothetical protein KatS3mg015_2899 [Fimbriimonadales bacterium]|nr:MAG: hypothetical protein KatS3mg015_2899 [Fimbriimonadales bacterium]
MRCKHCGGPILRPVYAAGRAWHTLCLADRIAALREIAHDSSYDAQSREVARRELARLT